MARNLLIVQSKSAYAYKRYEMQNRLLIWIRENGLNQAVVAVKAGMSPAWLSKRLRGHKPLKDSDRTAIHGACERLVKREVNPEELFESVGVAGRSAEAAPSVDRSTTPTEALPVTMLRRRGTISPAKDSKRNQRSSAAAGRGGKQ